MYWNLLVFVWVSSLFSFFGSTTWHMGSQFLKQGSNLFSLYRKHRVLTTGLPKKPWNLLFIISPLPTPPSLSVLERQLHSSVSWFIVYGNLNRVCIPLSCEHCIKLIYVWIGSSCFLGLQHPFTFLSIYCINFWDFDIETPTKNFNLST